MKSNYEHNSFSTEKIYDLIFTKILEKDTGIDPELLTQISLTTLGQISIYRDLPVLSNLLKNLNKSLQVKSQKLEQTLFNCKFSNPIGLAAGLDKNGVAAGLWDQFGFSHAELGTVTLHPQVGNSKPRLFRLAKEKAALNRMGFNNNGASILKKTLINQNIQKPGNRPISIGINLGKSKTTPNKNASEEYLASLEILGEYADYIVLNVSSPNTPGLRDLQNHEELKSLIQRLKILPHCPPLFVKIAPDLNYQEIENIGILAVEEKIAGIIAVNTSIDRLGLGNRVILQTGNKLSEEDGGLSGKPLQQKANNVIRVLRKTIRNDLTLIGVGGINSPESAWERLNAGASLIQIYTGWIYEGPLIVPSILNGLLKQLDKHKINHIQDVIGKDLPWL